MSKFRDEWFLQNLYPNSLNECNIQSVCQWHRSLMQPIAMFQRDIQLLILQLHTFNTRSDNNTRVSITPHSALIYYGNINSRHSIQQKAQSKIGQRIVPYLLMNCRTHLLNGSHSLDRATSGDISSVEHVTNKRACGHRNERQTIVYSIEV